MLMLKDLQDDMVLAKDVFGPEDPDTPLIRSGILLTEYVVRHLRNRGIRSVYVMDPVEGERAPQRSRRVLDTDLQRQALEAIQRLFALAKQEEQGPIEDPAPYYAEIDAVVARLAASMMDQNLFPVNINDLKSYDDFLFHSALSVAVLSIAIGRVLGYDTPTLHKLGLSAILHDIGKTTIPVEVLDKTSRLDDAEQQLIKTHTAAGFNFLRNHNLGDEEIWLGVLCHHEKMDGTGYPSGIAGQHIPELARIISVADVYDALTSTRPYRKPMEPPDAIEYMMGGSGTSFDINMVEALVQILDMYPVGSRVLLSDGNFATVVNNENSQRPIIRLDGSGEILDLFYDRACLNLVILRVVGENTVTL